MTDLFFRFCLSFSHATVIIPLAVLGFLFLDRQVFFHAVTVLLFSIVINWALKVTFQISVDPDKGKGLFLFPSGHMQTSCVFYGWLWCAYPHLFARTLNAAVLCGIGTSLVYFGYHSTFDVFGGLFFGFILIMSCRTLMMICDERVVLAVFFFSSSAALLYSGWRFGIKQHVSIAYFILLSLLCMRFICLFSFQKRAIPALCLRREEHSRRHLV
jgi:undecaprenyl-diphosphatase